MRTKLSQFQYKLPEELVAQYPTKVRDESKLMVVDRAKGTIEHHIFKDLLNFFEDQDTFIFNNTKFSLPDSLVEKKKLVLALKFFYLENSMLTLDYGMY